MNTPFLYLRISPKEKTQPGFHLGIDAQRTKCLAMATVKGWTVRDEDIFIDDNFSGADGPDKRPALRTMLDRIEREENHPVIIAALDRLGRRLRLTLDLVDTITKKNDVISCNESFDTTTAIGRFQLQIFAALGELERGRAIERTIEGLDALKQRGMQWGTIPYGMQRGEMHSVTKGEKTVKRYSLVPNPAEQEVISLVKQLKDQNIGIRGIASELNARGIPTRFPNGLRQKGKTPNGKWQPTQIARILATPNSRERN